MKKREFMQVKMKMKIITSLATVNASLQLGNVGRQPGSVDHP